MILHVLNSDSSGNCYLFESENSTLIIECGVRFKDVKKALNFDLTKVVGCLLTHEHGDHCKYINNVIDAGIDVFTSQGTKDAMGINNHRINAIPKNKITIVGEFKVLPFDVQHDCAEPFGFLINHEECGNVLFVTDSFYVTQRFKNLNNILIEANYSKEILDQRAEDGKIDYFISDRVQNSHMSVETCLQVLKGNDLKNVNNIVLLHLSNGNSDAKGFQNKVAQATGKNVFIADKGLKIELNKTPF